ncbi:hypothetical protein [Streptomyces lividans]|uniref:hypothetical protein n=1 Tax=Streptomyces lividans TaxID=1916 RepID=UPI0028BE069A|nr:hypothetical protein [Streptomyces lividans]
MREGGMPVGRGQPDGRPRTVAGVDPGQHPFAVGGDDLHVAPGQRRGVPGPVGGGRGRETGPGASGGERGPDAGLREQAAVRGDDGPGDDQTAAGQPFVIAQEGPEGDVGGAGAAGSLRSPRCDVAEGVPAAGVVDEMGQDTAQGTGSGDRFPADAVEAQRPVGAVVVVGGADQAGVGVGRLQTVGDEEELPQGGDRPGGPLDPVGTLRVARVVQVAYDVEGRALRTVQAGQACGVRGPEQLGPRDRARRGDPGRQDGRGRRPQPLGGADLPGGGPSRGKGDRCGGQSRPGRRGRVRNRGGAQGGGAVQAARGQEAGAAGLVR